MNTEKNIELASSTELCVKIESETFSNNEVINWKWGNGWYKRRLTFRQCVRWLHNVKLNISVSIILILDTNLYFFYDSIAFLAKPCCVTNHTVNWMWCLPAAPHIEHEAGNLVLRWQACFKIAKPHSLLFNLYS